MPKYFCSIRSNATSASSFKEIVANCVDFTNNRVSFYDSDHDLVASYPSELTIIYKIEYD